MSSRFSLEAVISMIDNVSNPMGKATNSVLGFSKKMQGGFGAASDSSSGFGNIIKGILGAQIIQSAAVSLKNLGLKAITLASDLVEVQNVVDTTFGAMSGRINEFAKTALEKFGLSELQAKKFSSTFGAMLKSSGVTSENLFTMSTRLTGLVGDFASFYNLDHETAFQKLRAGISGETEPLKQLGINMSVANMEAFALSQGIGKSWSSMQQAEQTMLRYNYILSVSKDAQGDFAKTLETSYANQKRLLTTNFDQFLARIATEILPDLTSGLKIVNKEFSKMDAKAIGKDLKYALDSVVGTFQKIAGFVERNQTAFKVFGIIIGVIAAIILVMSTVIFVAAIPSLIGMAAAFIFGKLVMLLSTFVMALYTIGTWLAVAASWAMRAAVLAQAVAWVILQTGMLPIILILAAIVIAGVLVYQNWETIKAVGISAFNTLSQVFFSFAYAFTYVWFGIIDAVLSGAEKVGGALGMNVGKIQAIRQEMGSIQADIQSRSMFASPNSQGGGGSTTGNINMNITTPPGAKTETNSSGNFGGMKLNTGVDNA